MTHELVWLDLEMTGLNPRRHRIIEIATVITDSDLNIIAEGPELAIHANSTVLRRMNDYVHEMHQRSGLLEKVVKSKITIEDAEKRTLDFIDEHIEPKYRPPLCGNSIGTDRRFLDAQMGNLENRLHYRVVDVSSIKELVMRWKPELLGDMPAKLETHRALDDVIESIEELKFYREKVFR
ncbi:MAG: oligoribonuclease [Candidatus Thermoplasmatota archaeon]|jgi:oligoribonuclease|nr:oligoribonuclease [Candidatus Thermoplasmatota archaeon]